MPNDGGLEPVGERRLHRRAEDVVALRDGERRLAAGQRLLRLEQIGLVTGEEHVHLSLGYAYKRYA